MEIGNQIRKYRTELGLNQEELADRVYVTRQTVSNWENERSYPDIRSLLLLSGVFGISLDILVKGDVEQMKVQIKEEEIRVFRKESLIYGLLLGATILLAIPMVKLLGWFGVMLWCGLIAVALVQSIRVEKLKKQHDIQTYREILAFLDGKRLDEVEYQREVGKRPYQRMALAVLTGLVSFLVCLLLGWLL
jgi:transcriptional regulator with XRE-family HTH domain